MLNNVPTAINGAVRQVVLRHPNSMPCAVWRKQVTRVENDPGTNLPSEMGGAPTLGGMGVLRSEDEAEFDYAELGEAAMLFSGPYQPSDMNDRDNALLQANAQEAVVEAKAEPGLPEHFVADIGDLVMLDMGLGVVLAYEVAGVTGTVHIPPYTRKLVLNPRDDLHNLDPFIPTP